MRCCKLGADFLKKRKKLKKKSTSDVFLNNALKKDATRVAEGRAPPTLTPRLVSFHGWSPSRSEVYRDGYVGMVCGERQVNSPPSRQLREGKCMIRMMGNMASAFMKTPEPVQLTPFRGGVLHDSSRSQHSSLLFLGYPRGGPGTTWTQGEGRRVPFSTPTCLLAHGMSAGGSKL